MQLSIDCPVTYLGMHIMLLYTIACNQIWSMAFLMTCTDLMLHISTRKAIPLAQGNQEEILGVLQQLTNQSWTVLSNPHYHLHYCYRYQRQIPSHHPPFHSSYRCECHSHKTTFASSSLMPQGLQARRTRRRSLVLRYAALITSTGRHQVLVLFLCRFNPLDGRARCLLQKNEMRTNYQAATIQNNSNPVLFSFRRRRSTHWMAGHDVYYKRTKRERSGCDNRQEQQSCSLFLS
jgi:hypothetical protein